MSLTINLRELNAKPEPVLIQTSLELETLIKHRKDIIGAKPLEVDLKAVGQMGLVRVDGECGLHLTLACSRCLNGFEQDIQLPFHELFTQADDAEDPGSEEDEDIHRVKGEKVDLAPYLEQSVLLGLPYVPLCAEECKGLCPVCGENRNDKDCGCSTEKVDPRLAGLKDFFK